MKKHLLRYALLCLIVPATAGCVKDAADRIVPAPEPDLIGFDYATSSPTRLSVGYRDMGGVRTNVYFELYDVNPVEVAADGSCYRLKEGIEPLFAGYTDENGWFDGVVRLPAYLEKAYIYTPAFYAQTLMEATLDGGTLIARDEVSEITADAATRANGYYSEAVLKDGWKTWLGTYDDTYGRIDYAYEGPLRNENYQLLYKASTEVFNTSRPCPQEYRSSKDLYLNESAEVAVTMLGSNTCWNCSMGYYYYREGEQPASLAQANVIMLFPNTQDGQWSNNKNLSSKYIGVKRGTAVQLIYYPRIAEGSREGATTAFPAGYRIGFVLATNAWTNRLTGFGGSKKYRAATSEGLSVNDQGVPYQKPRTAVYRYTNEKQGINTVLFSFEDYTTDQNFSDVVFTMNSNPVDAVVDVPVVDDNDKGKTSHTLKGIYAFEDLWPSRGDYHMNDVMVRLDYEKRFTVKGILEESFLLKTFRNQAANDNGLALTLTGKAAGAKITCSTCAPGSDEFVAADFAREGDVLLLTDNVKTSTGTIYKITAKYDTPIATDSGSEVRPFIYRTDRAGLQPGMRWEVHIPYEAPTERIDWSLFGTGDDRSVPTEGRYYVRENKYPFAFFLAGATDSDLSPLLDPANEKTPVDELFPAYSEWVLSGGSSQADWYKKK